MENADYWTPNPTKFPHGLKRIVEKGKKLGIRIGLWFNPSIQNDFADWQKDAQVIIGLYKEYGICCFKIDGLQIPTKTAEQNLRRLFDAVLAQTNHEVIFNLDATAGRRGGYHYMNEYGNIFLETVIPIGATIIPIAPCVIFGCCLAMYRPRRCR